MAYSSSVTLDIAKTTLWMGEIEPWMDEGYIRQLWFFLFYARNSMGEDVSVKVIRDKMSSQSLGYCFVDFGNNTAALRQLTTVQGLPIPGTNKTFKLNWASGGGLFDKRDGLGQEYSVFVGDLSQEVNDLNTFQARYSSVKSAKVIMDPRTLLSKGYGFVKFSSELDQQRAMTEMNGQFCGSRPIRINAAASKRNPVVTNQFQIPTAGNQVGANMYNYMYPQMQFYNNQFQQFGNIPIQQDNYSIQNGGYSGVSTPVVQNLNNNSNNLTVSSDTSPTVVQVSFTQLNQSFLENQEQEIRNLFVQFGQISNIDIDIKYISITFANRSSAMSALVMNHAVFKDKRIRVQILEEEGVAKDEIGNVGYLRKMTEKIGNDLLFCSVRVY